MRREIDDLKASRRRLALADDEERRELERELHNGVQQDLAALAVSVQLAMRTAGPHAEAVAAPLAQVARDVELTLAAAQRLAQRIYPPLLDAGGLVVAIRSAAATANVKTRVDARPSATYPPEVARVVYVCCLEVLEHATPATEAAVTIHDDGRTVAFEVVAECAGSEVDVVRLRDRVEAIGGRLTLGASGEHATRLRGSIPLAG